MVNHPLRPRVAGAGCFLVWCIFASPVVVGSTPADDVSEEGVQATASPADSTRALERYRGLRVGRIYCTGNGRTRERVIVQEVLMRSGDPFDPALARETERNLRSLEYLSMAEVVPHPDPDRGEVDLEVVVRDSWPWVGAVVPNFAGGRREMEIVLGNGNFRGMGQTLGVDAFVSNEVADSYMMFFVEPRVLGSRWAGAMTAGTQKEVGNQNRLSLRRPFFSLATPWAYEFSAFDEASETLLYDAGFTVSDYYRKRRGVALAVFRSFGARSPRIEVGGRYVYRDDEHRQAEGWHGVLPPDKKRAVLTVKVSADRYRFVEDTYFDLMGPVEDLKLGLRGALRAGGAAKWLGSDRSYAEVGAGARWFEGSPAAGYVLVETDIASRADAGRFANTVFRSTLGLYRRVLGRGLLAGRAGFAVLDRMEDPDQLLLDSPNGLRGYSANSFDGTRRFITNLEWRQPLWDLGWVVVGSVLFADAGSIWAETEPAGEAPFLVGAGGGVRLGFAGFLGAPVVRLDWGYGFDVHASEVSFGFGQRF